MDCGAGSGQNLRNGWRRPPYQNERTYAGLAPRQKPRESRERCRSRPRYEEMGEHPVRKAKKARIWTVATLRPWSSTNLTR